MSCINQVFLYVNDFIALHSNVELLSNIYQVSRRFTTLSIVGSLLFVKKQNNKVSFYFFYLYRNLVWRHLFTFLRSYSNVNLLKPVNLKHSWHSDRQYGGALPPLSITCETLWTLSWNLFFDQWINEVIYLIFIYDYLVSHDMQWRKNFNFIFLLKKRHELILWPVVITWKCPLFSDSSYRSS